MNVNRKFVTNTLLMTKQDMFIATNALWVKVIGDNMIFGARRIVTMTGTQENGSVVEIMNRDIVFRGKRIDNGEWVEGALFDGTQYCVIGQNIKFSPYTENECKIIGFVVDRSTVGQLAGLCDKNATRIFEGDIISFCGYKTNPIGMVSFKNCQWIVEGKAVENMNFRDDFYFWATKRKIKVIGNIFDNPELEV